MIDSFRNKYSFLSNYELSPFTVNGVVFPTMEHYFQAMKATNQEDLLEIAKAPTPGQAKRLGRKVKIRPDWEYVKKDIMLEGLRKKFAIPELRQKLLDTGDAYLEEGNTWHDNYWGVCHCVECQDVLAKNNLGLLLMKVREEIQNECS